MSRKSKTVLEKFEDLAMEAGPQELAAMLTILRFLERKGGGELTLAVEKTKPRETKKRKPVEEIQPKSA